MRTLLATIVLASIVTLGFALNSEDREEAAVREALQHYLDGHATGDGAHHAQVFHPESKLFWMRDGELNQRTSASYIERASGGPADNEAERRRWISSVDITGDVAVAKIILDYPGVYITDYMSMIKVDGKWQIINKIFHVERDSD